MKTNISPLALLFFVVLAVAAGTQVASRPQDKGYVLEREQDLAKTEPAPHNGGGISTAYSFFNNVPGYKLAFRKRVLHPGAAIGYHLQREDEVYYILSGTGTMQMNGSSFTVQSGDAILTRPGSSHGLQQTGIADLVVLIVYEKAE